MSYDRALTVFSPDGHLFQVEYAMEAVNKGTLAVGLRGKDVAVFAVEKKSVPDLQDARPVRKICQLDHHLLCTFAGLNADARVLINKARIECQNHRLNYEDLPTVEYAARYIATVQQKYTQKGGVRPFGVCTLIMGMEKGGVPKIYLTEPSGIHSEWLGNAIGRNSKAARDLLETKYDAIAAGLDRTATIKLAVQALLEVVQSGANYVEVAVMHADGKVQYLEFDQVKTLIEEIEAERVQQQQPQQQ